MRFRFGPNSITLDGLFQYAFVFLARHKKTNEDTRGMIVAS